MPPKDFADELCDLIRRATKSQGVTLFWSDDSHQRLTLAGTTGITWYVSENQEFYRKDEGLTGKVWASRKPMLSARALEEPGRAGKSSETVPENLHSCLWQPVFDSHGEAIGLVRCQNKRIDSLGGFNMFSDEDIAIIEAVAHVAAPHYELIVADERRREALARMIHELMHPATVIHSAIHMIQAEFHTKGIDSAAFFKVDYPGDIQMWSDLMVALIGKGEYYGSRGELIELEPARVLLMAQVIAPAVRQVDALLREEGYSARSIEYERLEKVPALWIDQKRFQQVMFNLLSNAIKYAFRDKSFQVEIGGEKRGSEYRLYFRDWGEGIPYGYETSIFREGFRAPRLEGRPIKGQGYGLWIVDSIIRAHDGRVEITKRHLPTEISIFLPEYLEWKPPTSVSV
jgi:signal transduction histidine kinase